eukprot:6207413-Pleurochrysis_carterae.AAC.2
MTPGHRFVACGDRPHGGPLIFPWHLPYSAAPPHKFVAAALTHTREGRFDLTRGAMSADARQVARSRSLTWLAPRRVRRVIRNSAPRLHTCAPERHACVV